MEKVAKQLCHYILRHCEDKTIVLYEPQHDKSNEMCAQQSLRSAWVSAQTDQSLQCPQWVAKDSGFLHADSED